MNRQTQPYRLLARAKEHGWDTIRAIRRRSAGQAQTVTAIATLVAVGAVLVVATWALTARHRPKPATVDQATARDNQTSSNTESAIETIPMEPVAPLRPATGLIGADLGGDASLPALSRRFAAFARKLPEEFVDLKPLVRFSNDVSDLNATLLVGPFATKVARDDFCRTIRLQLSSRCESHTYSGDALSLPDSL